MDLPKRKNMRLSGYDYSTPGAYFITICTKDRKEILSKISVGDDAHIVPKNELSGIGIVCDKYINRINIRYENVTVDSYAIMPNHIHLLIFIHGTMRASSPTKGIESIVRSFKLLVTKEIGKAVWQRSYHDHIIRGEDDYKKIKYYVDTNVEEWKEDCFFNNERS